MSVPLEDAVRTVLDHGRKSRDRVEIPAADYAVLAGCYRDRRQAAARQRDRERDPAYERQLRQLYENAELDP